MKTKRLFAVVLLVMLVCHAASAELDLNKRFGGPALEYGGKTYYLKNRVSSVLAMGFNPGTNGSAGSPELILLLAVDDEAKTMLPLQIDPSTLITWPYEAEDGQPAQNITLRELFDSQPDGETGCLKMMEAVNGLLPSSVVESYVALNLDGLTEIDGMANDGVNTVGDALMERLHVVKDAVEQDGDPAQLLSKLSDYIVSNMKSGALLKVADKAERYEVQPRTMPPALDDQETPDEQEAPETVQIDVDALKDSMIGVFYDGGDA